MHSSGTLAALVYAQALRRPNDARQSRPCSPIQFYLVHGWYGVWHECRADHLACVSPMPQNRAAPKQQQQQAAGGQSGAVGPPAAAADGEAAGSQPDGDQQTKQQGAGEANGTQPPPTPQQADEESEGEQQEQPRTPEDEAAKAERFWQKYLERDDSPISDLFGGQLQVRGGMCCAAMCPAVPAVPAVLCCAVAAPAA